MQNRMAIGLLAAGLLLAGCGGTRSETTAIDSTLVNVLVELHLLSARQAVVGDVTPTFRDSVLARYGLDSATVARRLQRYARDPEAFRQLYQQIQERLMLEHYGSEATPR
ncbi:DUF4296 domain-containing protein [Rhodothermus marinus]|uniref:DUF4296 domain-containing protein n=1 Tax=Rhodothermus marinus TaxID=29549 RepID=UPI0006D155BF|nr:DUF4296 domain-containing protein [Rhodothermus marinus]